jgi:hypothetical protein
MLWRALKYTKKTLCANLERQEAVTVASQSRLELAGS